MFSYIFFCLFLKSFGYELLGGSNMGYYYINVYFGVKQEVQSLILDSGSSLLITDCSTCKECGNHLHQSYNIDLSISATSPNGFMNYQCQQQDCQVSVSYMEGSSYEATQYKELISFDKETSFDMIIGCVDKETNLFYTQKADGILGISQNKYHDNSTPIIYEAMKHENIIQKKQIGICLSKNGGNFNFNWNEKTHLDKNIQKAQFQDMNWQQEYEININNIQIDGNDVIQNQFAILDCGTTESYFPTTTYKQLIQNIEDFCQKDQKNCLGNNTFEKCNSIGILESRTILEMAQSFPTILFQIKNIQFEWKPIDYMIITQSEFCYGFDEDKQQSNMITLGQSFFINKDILIDIEKQTISIMNAQCSENKNQKHEYSSKNLENSINKKLHKFYTQKNERRLKTCGQSILIILIISALSLILGMIYNKRNKEKSHLNYINLEEINQLTYQQIIIKKNRFKIGKLEIKFKFQRYK